MNCTWDFVLFLFFISINFIYRRASCFLFVQALIFLKKEASHNLLQNTTEYITFIYGETKCTFSSWMHLFIFLWLFKQSLSEHLSNHRHKLGEKIKSWVCFCAGTLASLGLSSITFFESFIQRIHSKLSDLQSKWLYEWIIESLTQMFCSKTNSFNNRSVTLRGTNDFVWIFFL